VVRVCGVLFVLCLAGASCGQARARSLRVFAAASLTDGLTGEQAALPGYRLTFNYAGSQNLVQQIIQGAPADVIATADVKTMQRLVDAHLVEAPVVFARNRLEIAVAPGNPKHVTGLADLARSDVSVVLDDPSVPAGNYASQALSKLGVSVRPKSLELDVRSALGKVTAGEVDATIVYQTDVTAAGPKASGVSIPDAQNIVATYPVAAVRASRHLADARRFVADLLSTKGQQPLRRQGFLAPT
jgi:molybdate transport system substrate-binding protein